MAYNNLSLPTRGVIFRIKVKIGKMLAKSAPYFPLRKIGLKLCGYQIGKNVYVGEDTLVVAMNSEDTCKLIIEDRVAIAPRVTLVLASDANWSNLMDKIKPIRGTITIRQDAWIGAGAIILPNVTIGKSSIVAAGAVVTKDVPDFSVVSGVPAKILKRI